MSAAKTRHPAGSPGPGAAKLVARLASACADRLTADSPGARHLASVGITDQSLWRAYRLGGGDASLYDGFTDDEQAQLRELDEGDGVIILTDMFGGTASNLALPFLARGEVEVVTGVNLPMLIKLASLRSHDVSLYDLAVRLTEAAQKSMRVASDFLRKTT